MDSGLHSAGAFGDSDMGDLASLIVALGAPLVAIDAARGCDDN